MVDRNTATARVVMARSFICVSADAASVGRRGQRRDGWTISKLDDLEVVCRDRVESGVEDTVVPARVVAAADVQVRSVVRNDQAVLLHCAKDLLDFRRITGDAS